jgi:hypothetical protein
MITASALKLKKWSAFYTYTLLLFCSETVELWVLPVGIAIRKGQYKPYYTKRILYS